MQTTDRHSLSVVFRLTARGLAPGAAWWALALFVLGLLVVVIYGRAELGGVLATACPNEGVVPMTIDSWLNMELFSWMPLIVGLFGIMAACRAVAGLIDDGSIELLMAGPVPPRALLWGRFLPVVAGLLVLHLALLGGMLVGFMALRMPPSLLIYLAVLSHSFLLSVVMAAIGLLLSVLTGRLGTSMACGLGILVVSFVYDMAVRGAGGPDSWRMITPIGYYTSCQIMGSAGMFSFNLIYLSGWLTLLLASSLHMFANRDLV